MASQYFIRRGRKIIGPVSLAKVKQSIANGKVLAEDQISKLRDGPWQVIGKVSQLAPLVTAAPPVVPGTPRSQKKVISDLRAAPEVDQLKASSLPPGVGAAPVISSEGTVPVEQPPHVGENSGTTESNESSIGEILEYLDDDESRQTGGDPGDLSAPFPPQITAAGPTAPKESSINEILEYLDDDESRQTGGDPGDLPPPLPPPVTVADPTDSEESSIGEILEYLDDDESPQTGRGVGTVVAKSSNDISRRFEKGSVTSPIDATLLANRLCWYCQQPHDKNVQCPYCRMLAQNPLGA